MLPKDLKRPIDDLESPSNRILVVCLLLAIIFLSGIYYSNAEKMATECAERTAKQTRTIDSLFQVISFKTDMEIEILSNKVKWQDSVKNVLQNEIKNEIKRKR